MIASRKRLDGYLAEALEAGLLDLAAKTEQGADLDSNIPARHQITVFLRYAVGVSVLLGLALAVLYSRNQALRIMRVKENTVRFVNNDNLLTVLRGDDEIADLDKAFHDAARQIEAAHRSEAAILENATDLILSIDEDLVIKSINQSSKNTIGKEPEQLVGAPLTSLVLNEDATMLSQSLKQLIHSTTHRAELEVHLLREDDEPLNVIVSAKYSPRDQTFYCIMHDVTTQREMEKLRREVVAMITHDLRTPLGTIKIFMEMQKDGMLGELNERGLRLLELADRESKRMATLLDGVLTLEKIRSGNMTLEPVTIDLFDLLNSCSQALALIAQEKNIKIELKPFEKISIKGDRVWLEQVVINIVSNALKFSPQDSQVTLGARCVEERLAEITIADQGPGVPEADRLKIFERFHRVTATSHKVGHGLGLSICKDLILLHNGSISCESTQGKGCTFIILLPLAED
ncbi:MAG: PAS domain-containing protein [Candidatus Melainabacteria bacterium]|nr:PAS domain-containing protein [Candidatus Melainabacteria bacterium]